MVQNDRHKMLAINGMPDHIHIFLGLNPAIAISDLVKDIKRASNNWINEKEFIKIDFEWQSGYGTFSYGKSQIDWVCKYILNKKIHHAKFSFKEEYVSLLELFQIGFKDEYLFEFYDYDMTLNRLPLWGNFHDLLSTNRLRLWRKWFSWTFF